MLIRRCVFSWFENGCDNEAVVVVVVVDDDDDDDAVWELDWDDGCDDDVCWLFEWVAFVFVLLLLFWLFEFEPFEEPTELAGDGGGISLGLDCNVCNWDWFLLLLFWLVEMLDLLLWLLLCTDATLLLFALGILLEAVLLFVTLVVVDVTCLYSWMDSLVRRISLRFVSQSHLYMKASSQFLSK